MRCLVTGASGHLGSFLVRELLRAGEQVSILVRRESDLWRLIDVLPQIDVAYADLNDMRTASPEIRRLQPETVFHLAWSGITRHTRNEPDRLVANVCGSLELFAAAKEAGCRCWVGVGSQAEYGPSSGVLTEAHPVRPDSGYGVAKHCVREMLEKLCALTGIRFVWFRLLATFGPADDPQHLIPSVIESLLEKRSPALTSGNQYCDYLYVEDAAVALHRAALIENVSGTYNLASGIAVRVRDIAEQIRDLIDPTLSLSLGAIQPATPVCDLRADVSLFSGDAQWAPAVSLARGLKMTVDWHKSRIGVQ